MGNTSSISEKSIKLNQCKVETSKINTENDVDVLSPFETSVSNDDGFEIIEKQYNLSEDEIISRSSVCSLIRLYYMAVDEELKNQPIVRINSVEVELMSKIYGVNPDMFRMYQSKLLGKEFIPAEDYIKTLKQ